jgi:hypothetical protein
MARPRDRLPDGTFVHQLYPERAKRLVEGCRGGLFDAQNAHREGIDVSTLRSWVERGLDEDADEPFLSFAEAYVKASIALEQAVIKRILGAADEWDSEEQSTEETRKVGSDDFDADSYDTPPGQYLFKKTKQVRGRERGDWRAAAWFAERRWPLRWGITRQPEGGPKEALRLPDAPVNRARMLRDRLVPPPPELVKLYREAGYELTRAQQSAAEEKPPP